MALFFFFGLAGLSENMSLAFLDCVVATLSQRAVVNDEVGYLQSRRISLWSCIKSIPPQNDSLGVQKKKLCIQCFKKGGKKNNNNTHCKKYKQSNELCRFRELIDEKKNRRDKHKNRSQKEAARRRTNHKRWSIVTTYLTRWDRHFQVGFYCNWRINEEQNSFPGRCSSFTLRIMTRIHNSGTKVS